MTEPTDKPRVISIAYNTETNELMGLSDKSEVLVYNYHLREWLYDRR